MKTMTRSNTLHSTSKLYSASSKMRNNNANMADPRDPNTQYDDFPMYDEKHHLQHNGDKPQPQPQPQCHRRPNLPWLMEYWSSSFFQAPTAVMTKMFACGSSDGDQDYHDEGHPATFATAKVRQLRSMVASHDETFVNYNSSGSSSGGGGGTGITAPARSNDSLRMPTCYDDDMMVRTEILWDTDSTELKNKMMMNKASSGDSTSNLMARPPHGRFPAIRLSSILCDDDDDDDDDDCNDMSMVDDEDDDDDERRDGIDAITKADVSMQKKNQRHHHSHQQQPHPQLNDPASSWGCTNDQAMWLGGGNYLARCESFDTDMMLDASRKLMDCSHDGNTSHCSTRTRGAAATAFMMDDSYNGARQRHARRANVGTATTTTPTAGGGGVPNPSPSPSDQTYTTISLTQSYIREFDEEDAMAAKAAAATAATACGELLRDRDDSEWLERLSDATHFPSSIGDGTPTTHLRHKAAPFRGLEDYQDGDDDDAAFATPIKNTKGKMDDDSSRGHEAFGYLMRMKPQNYHHEEDVVGSMVDFQESNESRMTYYFGTSPPSMPLLS